MKKYLAPKAEIFGYRYEDIMSASNIPTGGEYGGDNATDDSVNDPF